ncbi:hypothetical protein BD410DRAFT_766063 [Rickenella mellea]|uniref:Uncharacterized protein n=1 Tax=Rickenella mellea TaxID=50990 RepID=A0A4Y7QF03_9AGAM|nr:hypothetical protein BD410DRAFT_766063 [Rickenella mellea]
MIYTFTEWKSDSTLVMPPRTALDLRPIYHISVGLNLAPFTQISYATTIRRGGTAQGTFVGSFSLSVTDPLFGLINFENTSLRIDDVLFKGREESRRWRWHFGNVRLLWDCRTTLDDGSPHCVCYEMESVAQVATLVPPPLDAVPPLPTPTLTIFPDGHALFDHILLSALIIERKRSNQ